MASEQLNDLETAFVGSLLLRDDAVFDLPAGFSPAVFGFPVSRKIFEAVERLAKAKKRIELPLVAAEAKLSQPQTEWLREAMREGTMSSILPHAELLLERLRGSNLRAALERATEALAAGDKPLLEVAAELTTDVAGLSASNHPETVTLAEIHDEMVRRIKAGTFAPQLGTGFLTLDAIVRIRPSNLVVLAAQAGMGKSTLALNIAENVARGGGHVVFHSLEMDDNELWSRIAARATRLPVDRLSTGSLSATEVGELSKTPRSIPLHFNCGRFGLSEMLHLTERAHRRHGLKLAVFDYLGLTEVPGDGRQTEESKLAAVTRACKQFAQRLKVPVLLVAQLNRDVDRRQDGKQDEAAPLAAPRLSDLRGSGRIGQDANAVLLLHNPHAKSPDVSKRLRGPYQLLVEKNRMGRRGFIELYANLALAEFTENANGKAVVHAE